jgi:hypothetical protein
VKNLLLLLILLNTNVALSKSIIPGLIPRFYSISAASDLLISPEAAHERAVRFGEDISLLTPQTDTNIWDPDNNKITNSKLTNALDKLTFTSLLASRLGQVRFTVNNGSSPMNVIISKKSHNYLLRKNILEKIGFKLPKMQWLDTKTIYFNTEIDKDIFIEEMKDELLASPKRWITSQTSLSITLQDIILIPARTEIYNLALGLMPSDIHRGRRLLRSPYVPISLVDTSESLNLFSWNAGRVILNQIKLNHTQEIQNSYNTSYEDAQWIARRVAILNREDFVEIVEKAHYPKAVEKLLIEKLISRRNHLLKILKIDSESKPLEFNYSISHKDELINGEIKKEFFSGYASRFSFGNPESPFSNSELGYYALSRVQSEGMKFAISKFNKLLGSDSKKLYTDAMKKIIDKDGLGFPTQAVAIPMAQGSLILSRDIITGSYMGTDHKVQLADNMGYSLDLGALVGIEGLPETVSIKASAGVSFQRLYTHVKPILSLKKALNENYKNLIVPMLLKGLAEKINKLKYISEENSEMVIAGILSEIKQAIGIGESFIITDSIVPRISSELGLSLSAMKGLDPKLLKIYGEIQAQKMTISRFHIHRANENTIHIYKDDGRSLKLSMSMKLKSYIPILSFNARWNKAKAQTLMFPVSLKASKVSADLLRAFRKSILSVNSSYISNFITPHKIEHKISEFANTLNFLFFKNNKVRTNHDIEVFHADGGKPVKLVRRYDAFTSGKDYEGYVTETINNLTQLVLESDFSLQSNFFGNPGNTFKGKAKNLLFSSEFDGNYFYTKFQKVFNGWKANQKSMRSFFKRLNSDFGAIIFDPDQYVNTKSIMLYQIQNSMQIDHQGIINVLNAPKERIESLLSLHSTSSRDMYKIKEDSRKIYRKLKSIKKYIKKSPKTALKKWHSLLKSLLSRVTIIGFKELAGDENISATGRIDGFRQGDEDGDKSIVSDIHGSLAIPLHTTPSAKIIQTIGITPGELFASWLTERAL